MNKNTRSVAKALPTLMIRTYSVEPSSASIIMGLGDLSDALGDAATGLRTAFMWIMPISFLAIIMHIVAARFYPSDSANINDEVPADK